MSDLEEENEKITENMEKLPTCWKQAPVAVNKFDVNRHCLDYGFCDFLFSRSETLSRRQIGLFLMSRCFNLITLIFYF